MLLTHVFGTADYDYAIYRVQYAACTPCGFQYIAFLVQMLKHIISSSTVTILYLDKYEHKIYEVCESTKVRRQSKGLPHVRNGL